MADALHVSGKWIVKVGSYELFSVGKIREAREGKGMEVKRRNVKWIVIYT